MSKIYSSGAGAMKSVLGHYLHTFLDQKAVTEAAKKAAGISNSIKAPSTEDTRLIAIQIAENLACITDNQAADSHIASRIQKEAANRVSQRLVAEKEKWLSDRFLGQDAPKQEDIESEIAKASELLGEDGDFNMTQALIDRVDSGTASNIRSELDKAFMLGQNQREGFQAPIAPMNKQDARPVKDVLGPQASKADGKGSNSLDPRTSGNGSLPDPSQKRTGEIKALSERPRERPRERSQIQKELKTASEELEEEELQGQASRDRLNTLRRLDDSLEVRNLMLAELTRNGEISQKKSRLRQKKTLLQQELDRTK